MKIRTLFLCLSYCWLTLLSAQDQQTLTIRGTVADASANDAVIGATVLMVNIKDSSRSKFAVADGDGKFLIADLEKAFYRLRVTNVGYKDYTKIIRLSLPENDLGTINLVQDVTTLQDVVIEGEAIAVQQMGDTTQYNAVAFKTNPDASAKDLVSKMPGIVVSSDGVSANGESVEQVLLDGKRFFGQDPLLSLNTIPADMVDKVQVYDEKSDQSQFTGFDDGNTTMTMNLITKADKRIGQFGKVYGGYGENELYKAGANINSFSKNHRLTFLGLSNNINQQNFGSEDLVGIGGGGRGGRREGGNQNFITGQQDGITRTHSTGLNFSTEFGKNTTFEGSYFFNQTRNRDNQLLDRSSFLSESTQTYTEEQQSVTDNANHRLNIRLNHKINENNNLLWRTSFSAQNRDNEELTDGETTGEGGGILSNTFNNYISESEAFNFNNTLIFQHKFEKAGRTISFNLNTQVNPTDSESLYEDLEADSLIQYNSDQGNNKLASTITYTEPIGTTAQFSGSYEISYTRRKSDINTFVTSELLGDRVFNEGLSNNLLSDYTTHSPRIRFSNNKFGNIFDLSLQYEYARLNNEQLVPSESEMNRSFHNFLPSALLRMNLGDDTDFFARYATSATAPSVNQLQTIIDNSNPLFVSLGNASLDQTYTHTLNMRFRKNIFNKNMTLANRTNITTSKSYIGTSTTVVDSDSVTFGGVLLAEGAQISQPVNVDGYWSVSNNTTYGILISPIKNNLNLTTGLTYTRLPGLTNDVRNVSNTYGANLKLGLASNISEKIDYNLYYQLTGSIVRNAIQPSSNVRYYTQTIGTTLNFIFPKGIVFRNETLFQKYNGLSDSFDTRYTLWNMGVAKKFLKNDRGELELSVFDLLGENQSFDQTITAQYVQETQTKVLQRYFMLTFTYQLRSFK